MLLHIDQRRIERKLAKATDPTKIAHLKRQLAYVKAAEAERTKQLHAVKHQAQKLVREARALEAQAAQLEQQKQSARVAGGGAPGPRRRRPPAAGQRTPAAGHRTPGSRRTRCRPKKAQLDALQAKAAKQQKQANQLHSQLEKTLTKAGGDARATDPRLVKLQNALINTKGDQLVSPPQISTRRAPPPSTR